ncbi:MAG: tRNA (adenosine(37)-N6)-dimethylallyltransferase MiaA [Verrucomicrobiota bacterium]
MLYLSGPTGSGKTAVAIEIAKQLGNGEIVNADAYQIYQQMPILTAAPSSSERQAAPHHLYEVLAPTEECDVARFAQLAKAKITELQTGGKFPIITGGSGLYLKALTHGLAPTPPADPEIRSALDLRSLESLVEEYRQLDPAGAEKTNLQNRRYVSRNLEICLITSRPASELKSEWQIPEPDIDAFFLKRERQATYDRINRRTHIMFDQGAVAEVAALPGELSSTAGKAIGIRDIQQLLKHEIDEPTCIANIQQTTRRYAKRQETWFKREPAFQVIEVTETSTPQDIANHILAQI